MTRWTFVIIAALGVAFGGCSKKDEGSGAGGNAAAASGGSIGIKECDEYVTKYEGCFAKMDPITKAAAEPGFKAQRDAFKQTAAAATTPEAKAAVANSCKQALTALASNPACGK